MVDVNMADKFGTDPIATVLDADGVPVTKDPGGTPAGDGVALWSTVRTYLQTTLSLAASRITSGTLASARLSANQRTTAITFVIDAGGSALTTGIKGDLRVPHACTIQKATLLADQSTTTTIDVWKDTFANFPPTDADSITASAQVATSAADSSEDATLTGWTTSISAGDILRFNVDANDNATRVTVSLEVLVD